VQIGGYSRCWRPPVIEEFMAAHQLPDVMVVADAGMISDANMKAIEAAACRSSWA
jgi:hypothetical protein